MDYGHLHQVLLEHRAGENIVTFVYGAGLREACQRGQGKNASQLTLFATSVRATPQIVLAFNQGDAQFIRSNDEARQIRWLLLEFLKAHEAADARWHIILDDFQRGASLPLCVA